MSAVRFLSFVYDLNFILIESSFFTYILVHHYNTMGIVDLVDALNSTGFGDVRKLQH